MAKLPKDWERRLVELAAIHGVTDFIARGRLTKAESKLFFGILNKLGRPTVTTAGRLAGTAAMGTARALPAIGRGVRFVTMRHPYIAAAVVTYEVVKNRDQIAQLAREGWEVVAPAAEAIYDIAEPTGVYDVTPAARLPFTSKRKASKYNKAVSRAMKAVKASTKGGKKGTISKPKSVFKTVSKTVSKVNRGVKVGTKGIIGIAARAARKVLGKKKKPKKGKATFTYRKN